MKDDEKDNRGFGSLFKGLDKFIGLMADMIEEQKDEIDIKGAINDPDKKNGITGSYGFNIRLGAENINKIQERMNIIEDRVNNIQDKVKKAPVATEPLTDIFEENEKVTIVMEFPGVKEEDIHINIDNSLITVTANNRSTSFSKQVPLKFTPEMKNISAKLNNSLYVIIINKHD